MPVFIKKKAVRLTLNSATDINLATWIQSKNVTKGNVIVTIPASETIGGTIYALYAINVGDIRQFDDITLEVKGNVEGKGGGQNGDGSHGIYSVYPITINIHPGGEVKSGGGGGGDGKTVAGYWTVDYGSWYNSFGIPRYRWEQTVGYSDGYIRWNDTIVGYFSGMPQAGSEPTVVFGSYTYQRASWVRWEDRYWDVRRGTSRWVNAITGGAGGLGEGYLQAATLGEAANNDGGDGGTFGVDGQDGEGMSGNGGTAGYAIYGYEGQAAGIIVNNNGVLLGRTYY